MLTKEFHFIDPSIIIVPEDRQRKDLDISDLLPSIRQHGMIHPLVITRERVLVTGGRRLKTALELKLPEVPIRFVDELSKIELKILEREENVKRRDLEWKEEALAIKDIHDLYCSVRPNWSQNLTADEIGLSSGRISRYIRVAQEILAQNPKVLACTGINQASLILERDDNRRFSDAVASFAENLGPDLGTIRIGQVGGTDHELQVGERGDQGAGTDDSPEREAGTVGEHAPSRQSAHGAEIISADFHEWASTYSGLKFNFLHFDFPYGIGLDQSAQATGERAWEGYADSEEVYWNLLNTLAKHQDKFVSPSAHMMFWFSMEFYDETLKFFSEKMPDWTFQKFPLYWLKSDGRGIIPDAKRGPRRIVETALIGSRGDRLIVKPVNNGYPCPCGQKAHQSEKPEPMLRHFFQMFVDEYSRVLDPTCGSGTSIRAAESLGANQALGLELNPQWAEEAQRLLMQSRGLRKLSLEVAS